MKSIKTSMPTEQGSTGLGRLEEEMETESKLIQAARVLSPSGTQVLT